MEQMEYEDFNIEEDRESRKQTPVKTLQKIHTKDSNNKKSNTKVKCVNNVKRNDESEEESESEDEVTNECQSGNKNKQIEDADRNTKLNCTNNVKLKDESEDADRNTKLNFANNVKLEDESEDESESEDEVKTKCPNGDENKHEDKDESCENKNKTMNKSKNGNGDKEDTEKRNKDKIKNKDTEEYFSDATYLAQEMRLTEIPSAADLKKLYNLHVQLSYGVPPQHTIEKRPVSHAPTKDEMERFEKIVPSRKGTYSSDEDDIIIRNWKAFCKMHDWKVSNTAPFVHLKNGTMLLIRSNFQRRKFVLFLAKDLPNRTLFSVYQRFKTLHVNNINTRYTDEEDEMIIDHLENNPSLDEKRKYADLAKVLKRTRHSIWRRYRILLNRKKKKLNQTM